LSSVAAGKVGGRKRRRRDNIRKEREKVLQREGNAMH